MQLQWRMKNLPFSWRKKGADLYYVDDKKVMTLLKATHHGLMDVVKILLESTRPQERADTLTTGPLSCPMVILKLLKCVADTKAWRERLPSWRERLLPW
jgi:hypothetical protein